MAELSHQITMTNAKGLHARASAQLAEVAASFEAQVTISHNNQSADGVSILNLLMLGAGCGSLLTIRASGPEAPQALEAIIALIHAKFGENA